MKKTIICCNNCGEVKCNPKGWAQLWSKMPDWVGQQTAGGSLLGTLQIEAPGRSAGLSEQVDLCSRECAATWLFGPVAP